MTQNFAFPRFAGIEQKQVSYVTGDSQKIVESKVCEFTKIDFF